MYLYVLECHSYVLVCTRMYSCGVLVTIPTEDIMELLDLCLPSTYFQYKGTHYKQLHGTAMGSPVSNVAAEIVMQSIEERALTTYKHILPFWFCYVDDTITALHAD